MEINSYCHTSTVDCRAGWSFCFSDSQEYGWNWVLVDPASHVCLNLLVSTTTDSSCVQSLRTFSEHRLQSQCSIRQTLRFSDNQQSFTLRVIFSIQLKSPLHSTAGDSVYLSVSLYSVATDMGVGRRQEPHCGHLGQVLEHILLQRQSDAGCTVHASVSAQPDIRTLFRMGCRWTLLTVLGHDVDRIRWSLHVACVNWLVQDGTAKIRENQPEEQTLRIVVFTILSL